DVGVPVVMESLARIEVLVQGGAVEACEAVLGGRKMCRHPIQNDADAGAMQRVDETREASWRAVTCGRGEHAARLTTPRAAERMLGDGKQLHMGESHFAKVRNEAVDREVPERARADVVGGPHP